MRVQTHTQPDSHLTLRTASRGGASHAEEQKAKKLKLLKQAAIAGADIYVSAVNVMNPEAGYGKWFSGFMAAGHVVMGLGPMFSDSEPTPRTMANCVGHLFTAAGFGTMAFGAGVMGVPLVGIGQATVLLSEALSREEG